MAYWLAVCWVQSPSGKGLTVWGLHVLPTSTWVSSGCSGFPHKQKHVFYSGPQLLSRGWGQMQRTDFTAHYCVCMTNKASSSSPSSSIMGGRAVNKASESLLITMDFCVHQAMRVGQNFKNFCFICNKRLYALHFCILHRIRTYSNYPFMTSVVSVLLPL